MIDVNSKVEDLATGGHILLYQINPQLKPEIPPTEQVDKTDSNYGIPEDWTKQTL